jgi:hypothetical protein
MHKLARLHSKCSTTLWRHTALSLYALLAIPVLLATMVIAFCALWMAAWTWVALTRTVRSLVSLSSRVAEPVLRWGDVLSILVETGEPSEQALAFRERWSASGEHLAATVVNLEALAETIRRMADAPYAYDLKTSTTDEDVAQAKQRALELLIAWLSPSQREQFLRESCFVAIGSDSGKPYTVRDTPTYNVIDDDWWQYCSVLPPQIMFSDIVADRMLAQKIAIETDEKDFLARSNASREARWVTENEPPPAGPVRFRDYGGPLPDPPAQTQSRLLGSFSLDPNLSDTVTT